MSKYNKYQERAKKLLENTYLEIKDKVEILDANKIKELRDILNKYGDEIKRLINLGK
jgi:DNA mismatch repair ATPase MutS